MWSGGPISHALFSLYSEATAFHCFHFSVQLQTGTRVSAYSNKHMVWVSSFKIFMGSGGL